MHPRVGRSVVDEYCSVFVGNPAVGEKYIAYVTYTLLTLGYHKGPTGSGNQFRRVFQGSHVHIEHITQSGGTTADTMSQMQPSFRSLDGMRTFTILHLLDGVIVAPVDNLLFLHLGMGYVVHQRPADTTTAAGINKAILRTGIEGIFAIYKLRVQHYVALLALGLQVGQAFPVL